MAELLVWPALIAYGEAAVAYAGEFRDPGRPGRLATWGVRIGWLAQTALLLAQAVPWDGFPWGTWAGALNLLSWLVVSGYLVWGCRPRYRLLGLALMPVVVGLLFLAWLGGGTAVEAHEASGALAATHVAMMLAGIAGLIVAAAMSGMYLWEERRLKQRDSRLLRLRVPPLETLDRLAARVVAISLGLLSAGIALGLATFESGDLDATVGVTIAVWALYATVLVLRREAGLRGRRMAWLVVSGIALVIVVLPLTHFAT